MQENGNKQGPILIVAGMHRSGTSLLAQLLQDAGLNLGTRLLPAHESNRKGHVENVDFVELHKRVLTSQGLDPDGWTLKGNLSVPDSLRQEARSVIERNAQEAPWGWKDPRTTLFLDFWAAELPEACFVFVYRAPWEVVDSLFRRGDEAFQKEPLLALQIWEHYNRLLLEFAGKFPERSLIIDIESICTDWRSCMQSIGERLHIPVALPQETTFDSSLLKKEVARSHWAYMVKQLFPRMHDLWKELQQASVRLPEPVQAKLEEPACESQDFAQMVMRDWMGSRKAELELSRTAKTLYEVRSELYHANARLESIRRSRVCKICYQIRGKGTVLG
jgi:hypothetical protein